MSSMISGLSSYQKNVVKSLEKHCLLIPHRVERANTNHLKIFIEGVEKPIFASSTPSDRRALKNFEGELKAALKAREKRKEDLVDSEDDAETVSDVDSGMRLEINHQRSNSDLVKKLVATCVSGIKKRIDKIQESEWAAIVEKDCVEAVSEYRSMEASKILEHSKLNISAAQLSNVENRDLLLFLVDQLNFLLPSRASYAAKLKPKPEKVTVKISEEPDPTNEVVQDVPEKKAASLDPITALMSIRRMDRVTFLRNLDYKKAQALIEDITTAMDKNRDADMCKIMQIMSDSNISVDDIASHSSK